MSSLQHHEWRDPTLTVRGWIVRATITVRNVLKWFEARAEVKTAAAKTTR
jgi:hypothetical protein